GPEAPPAGLGREGQRSPSETPGRQQALNRPRGKRELQALGENEPDRKGEDRADGNGLPQRSTTEPLGGEGEQDAGRNREAGSREQKHLAQEAADDPEYRRVVVAAAFGEVAAHGGHDCADSKQEQ